MFAYRNSSGDSKDLFFQKMRRQRIQLSQPTFSQSDTRNATEATPSSSLPGNTVSISKPSQIKDNTQSSDLSKDRKPNFSSRDEPSPVVLQPYVPKSKRKSCHSQVGNYNKINPTGPTLPSVPAHKRYKPTDASWEDTYSIHGVSALGTASSKESYSQSHKTVQQLKQTHQVTDATGSLKQTSNSTKEAKSSEPNEEDIAQEKVLKELLHKDAKKNAALEQVQQALIGKKTGKELPNVSFSCNMATDSLRYCSEPFK